MIYQSNEPQTAAKLSGNKPPFRNGIHLFDAFWITRRIIAKVESK